jgi:type I restriction enzyme M protein
MTNRTAAIDIGAKLWSLCHVLRDDGVTYHQYLSELTYLLFLKMMKETGQEDRLKVWKRPKKNEPAVEQAGARWDDLLNASAPERLDTYKEMLLDYGLHGRGAVQEVYANANTFITKPATLSKLVTDIDALDWYSVDRDDLGDLYEDLLERNAGEKKSGAGQYFTPRHLIDSIVAVMKPQLTDVIQDPAAGTCGFLIAANNYLRSHNDFTAWTTPRQRRYRRDTFHGMELVQDTHRLALMNMLLHGIEGGVTYGDTLSDDYKQPAASHADPVQPALRHQERRWPAHPWRSHLSPATSSSPFCSTSTAASSPAVVPPWCYPTTCCSRATSAPTSAAT